MVFRLFLLCVKKNGEKKSFLTKVRNHTNIKVRFRTRRKRDGSETLK